MAKFVRIECGNVADARLVAEGLQRSGVQADVFHSMNGPDEVWARKPPFRSQSAFVVDVVEHIRGRVDSGDVERVTVHARGSSIEVESNVPAESLGRA